MTLVTGQKLQNGKYIIQQILGQGGFGITYKALQVYLNRPVVIKTPNE
jgi:serine/threonine-protein kinase